MTLWKDQLKTKKSRARDQEKRESKNNIKK